MDPSPLSVEPYSGRRNSDLACPVDWSREEGGRRQGSVLHVHWFGGDGSFSGLWEQSHLVHGLHFFFCSVIPFHDLQSSRKPIILLQPVWYCWGAIKGPVSKGSMGPFSPHPSLEVSGTESSFGEDTRPESQALAGRKISMASAEPGSGGYSSTGWGSSLGVAPQGTETISCFFKEIK